MSNLNFYPVSTVNHPVYALNPFRYLMFIVK